MCTTMWEKGPEVIRWCRAPGRNFSIPDQSRADYLTIPERVTALNIKQLQQYVDNGPHAEPFKTGTVWYGRGGVLLSNSTTTTRAFLKFGDVIHCHLKEGDLIIVNRPPSLQKHSLMALHVHMHVGSVFGINPLLYVLHLELILMGIRYMCLYYNLLRL
ncbi:unnamed protein product [Sphagnum balticum]